MRKIIILILSIFTNCFVTIAQNVLDLSDADTPIIKINGEDIEASQEGDIFCFESTGNRPIEIKKVVFAVNAIEAKTAEVFIGNKSLGKWNDVRTDIRGITFEIKSKSNVTIVWGNHLWTLKINEKTAWNKDGNNIKNEEITYRPNYVLFVFVALIMFVIGYILGKNKCILYKLLNKLHKITKGGNDVEGSVINTTEDGKNPPSDNKKYDGEADGNDKNVKFKNDGCKDDYNTNIDQLIETIIKGYEDKFDNDRNKRVERLKVILSEYYRLLSDKERLVNFLYGDINNVDINKVGINDLLYKIEDINKSNEKEVDKTVSDPPETINISDIENFISKNKKINDVYKSLKEKNKSERLNEFFKKLSTKIEKSIDPESESDIYKARKYVIEQLKDKGFEDILKQLNLKKFDDYFVRNTTLDSGFSKIKEDIAKIQEPDVVIDNTKDNGIWGDLVQKLKVAFPNIPDGISSVEDLAEAIQELINQRQQDCEKKSDGNSETAGSECSSIKSLFKKIGMTSDVNMETAINQLKDSLDKTKELKPICEQYNVTKVCDLCNAINSNLCESVKNILGSDENTKNIIAKCSTTEDVVKSLFDAYTAADKSKQDMELERNDILNKLGKALETVEHERQPDGNNMSFMFETYRKAVCKAKGDMQKIIDDNKKKFDSIFKEMKETLKCDLNKIQESINTTFIYPCDINFKQQCDQNQSLLRGAFENLSDKLKCVENIDKDKYDDLYKEVQKVLEENIADENGFTNILSRYYAYSCLPFMTDRSREYGMRINHETMMKAFNALCHVANKYGLQLIIPNLFADRISDGEYNDCTGEKYGDLENMCPGIANYVLNISNSDKQYYITDLVQVGYRKDNKLKLKANVIIAD